MISFAGPYSWPGTPDAPSVFDLEVGHEADIYFWTVPLHQGYLIYYVSETGRSFRARLQEHYTEHAAAMYQAAREEKVMLWPGRLRMGGTKPQAP